jgi:hypothetical protein
MSKLCETAIYLHRGGKFAARSESSYTTNQMGKEYISSLKITTQSKKLVPPNVFRDGLKKDRVFLQHITTVFQLFPNGVVMDLNMWPDSKLW